MGARWLLVIVIVCCCLYLQKKEIDKSIKFGINYTDQSGVHLKFLSDTDKDLSMLNRYPEIRELFIRYNTPLPSSASVERLFSAGAIVLSKRRNRLSDMLFEKLLLLKVNSTHNDT
jgi:hypothetical protein